MNITSGLRSPRPGVRWIIPLLLIAPIFLISCGGNDVPRLDEGGKSVEGTPEMDIEVSSPSFGVVNVLRATGNKVRVVRTIEQPFMPVEGKVLTVNGEEIQVYEFDSKEAVDRIATTISPDGSTVGNSAVNWTAPPHFYRTDKVMVIYTGTDSTTREALESAIAPQFAGRP